MLYRALVADAAATERARRPKPSELAANVRLRDVVVDKLDDDWSPRLIAKMGYLGVDRSTVGVVANSRCAEAPVQERIPVPA